MSDKLKAIEFVDDLDGAPWLDGAPRLDNRIVVGAPTGGGWPEVWASFARSAARDADTFVLDPELMAAPPRGRLSARTGF